MCPTAKSKARAPKKKVSEEPRVAKVRVVNTKGLDRVYANYARISHTNLDFTLSFCEIASPGEILEVEEQIKKSGVIEAPIVARIAIPMELMPILIETLQENLRRYEEHYGSGEASKEEAE